MVIPWLVASTVPMLVLSVLSVVVELAGALAGAADEVDPPPAALGELVDPDDPHAATRSPVAAAAATAATLPLTRRFRGVSMAFVPMVYLRFREVIRLYPMPRTERGPRFTPERGHTKPIPYLEGFLRFPGSVPGRA